MMEFLSIMDEKKSAAQLLEPLKNDIEKALGHSITQFQVDVDMDKLQLVIKSSGRSETIQLKKIVIKALLMALRKKMNKSTIAEFTKACLYYDSEIVNIVMYLNDGSIKTETL